MSKQRSAELADAIAALLDFDPNAEHPARPFALATHALALAEELDSGETFRARLLKARWLRLAATRGLCHPSIALPEIRHLVSAADTAKFWDGVSLERAWISAMEGESEIAAEALCSLVAEPAVSDAVMVEAGASAAIMALQRHELLSEDLVARLRAAHCISGRAITSRRDQFYFAVTRYAMNVGLKVTTDSDEDVREALVSFCNGESDPTPQVFPALRQLEEVLGPCGMWSEFLQFVLAVASSRGPAELRGAALTMAFESTARAESLAELRKVISLSNSLRDGIVAGVPDEARDAQLLGLRLAQAEAAVHLAGVVSEGEKTEAEITASESIWELARVHESARWPAIADDIREMFNENVEKVVARHQQMLAGLATRTLEELSLSAAVRPTPPKHPNAQSIEKLDVVAPLEAHGVAAATFPRTTRPRQVGVLAESIFTSACAALGWVVSKTPQESDYGIDFRVEPVFDHQIPGIEFFAQVKGTSRDSEYLAPTVSIRSPTASYWRAKLVPVIVVLVNVRDSTIRYGWFDGTEGTEPTGVTVRLDEHFPGYLAESLQKYYESIRTNAVSSIALDSMLEAAATLSYALADDGMTDQYPHLIKMAEEKHRDSKFTVGQIQGQLRLMLMSQAISMLRRPSPRMPELLDGPIAEIRREIIKMADSFTVSGALDRTRDSGLRDKAGNNVPVAAARIVSDVYEHGRPYLAYLASRLTMQLSMARSNLIRSRMSELGQQGEGA